MHEQGQPVSGEKAVRIAVASRDGRSIAGHIGKCTGWIVFQLGMPPIPDAEVQEVDRMTLPRELVFHHYRDDAPHPLDTCSVVIGASAGDSFSEKMQRRGIELVLTAEADPLTAVTDYLHHSLTPPKPRPIGSLICKLIDKGHDALS